MQARRTPPQAKYLALVFFVVWLLLALQPDNRADWTLETTPTVICCLLLFLGRRRYPLSLASWILLLLFGLLHTLGTHYTYSLVPYERWGRDLAGISVNGLLGWQRNNFDRIVHFTYGLTMVLPIQEWMEQGAGLTGRWRWWFPLEFIMATSLLYELLEWLAAEFFGGDLGAAYLGTQGDIWDAQKDMALALLGGVLGLLLIGLLRGRRRAA
jgi:putative membrane protein